MQYIDKNKLSKRWPCCFEETGEDALVSVNAVCRMLAIAAVDNVAPVAEVVGKIRKGIELNAFNPNNKFDFIFDEIYRVLDEVLEEYNVKKDS